MLDAKTALLVVLGIVGLAFVVFWTRALLQSARSGESLRPTPYEFLVGLVTDFFDTLGIGSFATTTSLYRARRTIDDRLLPGTLNVGHTIPTFVQALIYTKSVEVESTTLIAMIVASVAGALLGAPVVSRWPRRKVQLGMGCALLMLTTGLSGGMFALGVAGNFVLGALMTMGVGLYAPCLVMVSMLGMNPGTGFPIMMSSCAFLMPVASVPFVRQKCYAPRAALGLTLAGVPAVLMAHWWFESLNINTVKWLVAGVVVYTAITLLRAAAREKKD